jgi:hypothetical protein
VITACPDAVTASDAIGVWQDIKPADLDLGAKVGSNGVVAMEIAVAPLSPSTVFIASAYRGVWKSSDCGASWTKISTGRNADKINNAALWTFAIDPTDSDVVYTATGFGALGLWRSANGGVDWDQILTMDGDQISVPGSDVYGIQVDPSDHNHLIATSHSPFLWGSTPDSGVLEGKFDGTKWTWSAHTKAGLGSSQYAYFLENSDTWLVVGMASSNAGTWRTTDAGNTFDRVADFEHPHGNAGFYHSPTTGAFYFGTYTKGVVRSPNGIDWTSVSNPALGQSIWGMTGTGDAVYASNFAFASTPYNPTLTAPEDPGTSWSLFDTAQKLPDGGFLAADVTRKTIYSANWNQGVYRLVVQ